MSERARERYNNGDDVARVIATANADDENVDARATIADFDSPAISVDDSPDVVVAADLVQYAASGAAPPKAHEKIAALEAPAILAEDLHGCIFLLALAEVSF